MTATPQDYFMQAWKQQLDAGLRIIETVIEGAEQLREAQLQAAANAHADAEATRKAIAAASDPAQIFRLQSEWMNANVQKCMGYWRSLYDVVAQTDAEVVKCACRIAPAPTASAAAPDASKQAVFNVIDNAYRQWLQTTQQFYQVPPMRAGEGAGEKRAAA